MSDIIEEARRELGYLGIDVPEGDEEILKTAYDATLEDDFILAHVFRLGRTRPNWTREDWQSILDISGIDKITSNIAGLMACLSHGLIAADEV